MFFESLILAFVVWLMIGFFEVNLGLFMCKFDRTHKLGVRLLAMSVMCLTPPSAVPLVCRMDCDNSNCRNWTCAKYHKG